MLSQAHFFIYLFQITGHFTRYLNFQIKWLYKYSYQVIKICNIFNPRTQMNSLSKCQDFSVPLFSSFRIIPDEGWLLGLLGFFLFNLYPRRFSSCARISREAREITDRQFLWYCACYDRSATCTDSYRRTISHRVCRTGLSLFVLLMHW